MIQIVFVFSSSLRETKIERSLQGRLSQALTMLCFTRQCYMQRENREYIDHTILGYHVILFPNDITSHDSIMFQYNCSIIAVLAYLYRRTANCPALDTKDGGDKYVAVDEYIA